MSGHLPVAILAGGLATRMRPYTSDTPKYLIEVAGRPFGEHQLRLLSDHGFTDIVLCVGYLGDQIQDTFGDGSQFGINLRYVFDGPILLGTGGGLRQALPYLGEAFLILYGDSYLDCDYAAVENALLQSDKLGLMTVLKNNGLWDHSNVLFNQDRILRYDKRNPTPEMQHIDYGLGALRAVALADYSPNQPFDLALVYQGLIARHQLAGFEVYHRFYEVGSPAGLSETDEYLRAHRGYGQ
jgi:N-acetyl-alpha-D-muramate 1-phosphate uridylyltransferase